MITIALSEWLTNAQECLVLPGELPSWMVCAKTRSHSDSPKRSLARFQGLSRCRRWMRRGLRAPSSQCHRRAVGTGGHEGTHHIDRTSQDTFKNPHFPHGLPPFQHIVLTSALGRLSRDPFTLLQGMEDAPEKLDYMGCSY